ncbi:hypothetical protein IWW48_002165 [Coemansia sp. RSA 1200]|nr:hypothetical protein IWW48_002165 [Coemansia sp. RSA 1200]
MKRGRGSDINGRASEPHAFDLTGVRMPPVNDPQGKACKIPQRPRMFGLPEAPTFYPSAEEFADPLEYIQKIRPEAEKAGICKIVPPAGWNPPFSLDTKRFRFKTRIQQLNSLEGKTRSNLNYLDQLYKFHAQQGNPLTKMPQLDHRPIDLYDLRNEVATRGGYQKVNREKRWAEIGRVLKYDRKTCTSMSNTLKSSYQKIVLPFELYVAKHGGTLPSTSRCSSSDNPGDSSPGSPEETNVRRSKRQRSSRNPHVDDSTQSPESVRVSSPYTEAAETTTPTTGGISATTGTTRSSKTTGILPDHCEVCKSGEDDENMLICDGCDCGFHMYCLNPPLSSIPRNDWYCDACVLGTSADFGFEDGAEYSLQSFKEKCDEFKRKFFATYYNDQSTASSEVQGLVMEGRVPEDVVEREFWRLVASPYEDVEVEYGADLHSAQHGSGFPTAERNPLETYARHAWNLNVLPFERQSLFNYIQQDISGMMTPWIYVGMCFSTFCWHNEDHYTYSVNYMHWGDTKTWYGVPGCHAELFEDAMRDAVPQLFEDQPDLLFQLVTMLSPEVLVRRGVDVAVCDQRAGEFVVTFPQAYHAGFNQGFNFNEAVNFATPDWMPYDVGSIRRYQQYARNPVFSHDELLMTMCAADPGFLDHAWFQVAIHEMVSRELSGRAHIRSRWGQSHIREAPWGEIEEGDPDMPEDMRQQCYTCKAFSFLSAIVCDCSPNYISCLSHPDSSCKCEADRKILKIRHSDDELQGLLNKCKVQGFLVRNIDSVVPSATNGGVTTKAQIWEEEFRRVMSLYANSSKPNANYDQSVASSAAATFVPPAASSIARGLSESEDARSLGTASTEAGDSAVGAEDSLTTDSEQAKTKGQEQMDVDVPLALSQTEPQTMTIADLNRRPDLTQMVLLLEEAQRLVLREYEGIGISRRSVKEETPSRSTSAATAKQQNNSNSNNNTTPTRRGRPRGRGKGRGRGRPPSNAVSLATDHASSSRAKVDGTNLLVASANGAAENYGDNDDDDSEAWVVMLGKEIEQLMASDRDAPGRWLQRSSVRSGSNSGVPEDFMTRLNSTVDMQILGDMRQLSRFVQRAQEWCQAAQAFLMCVGRDHAVDRIVAKHKANYVWHKDKLRKRFGNLLKSLGATEDVSNELVLPMIPLSLDGIDAARSRRNSSTAPIASLSRREQKSSATDSELTSDSTHDDSSDDADYEEGANFVAPPSASRTTRNRDGSRRGGRSASRDSAGATESSTPRRGRRPGRPPKSATAAVTRTPPRPVGRPRKHPRPASPIPKTQSTAPIPLLRPSFSSAARKTIDPSPFLTSLVANMSTEEMIAVVRRFLGLEVSASGTANGNAISDANLFSLADLKMLLRSGDQLYFYSPEFQELIDLEANAIKAEAYAQNVLKAAPAVINRLARIPSSADVKAAAKLEDGRKSDPLQADPYMIQLHAADASLRSIGLQSSAKVELTRITQTTEWYVFARQGLLKRYMTADELQDLIQRGKQVGIDGNVELFAHLVGLDQEVQGWSVQAQTIIKGSQPMDLHAVGLLVERGRSLKALPNNYKALQSLHQKTLDMQSRIDQMVERMEGADLVRRPRYSEAVLLSRTCADLGRIQSSQLDRLNVAIRKAYVWSKDAEQLFAAVGPSSSEPSKGALDLVQYRLQKALEIVENSKTAESSSSRNAPQTVPTGPLYCVCLRPESGLMVECEQCREWYHAQCVGLKEIDINDKPYVCQVCVAESRGEKPLLPEEYPSESRIQQEIDEGRALHLVSNTLDPLVTILLESRTLSSNIREVCDNRQLIYKGSSVNDHIKSSMHLLLPAETKEMRVRLLRTLIRTLVGLGITLKQTLLDGLWSELQATKAATVDAAMPMAALTTTPSSAYSADDVPLAISQREPLAESTTRAMTMPVPSPGSTNSVEELDQEGKDNSAADSAYSMVVKGELAHDEPQPMEIDEYYQRRLEELVFLIVNPPPEEQDRGQGLEAAGNVFRQDAENCVCNIPGSELAHPEVADAAVVLCDACHEYFHINCVQLPPGIARVIEVHQMQRTVNAEIEAEIPEAPSSYMCPNCCIQFNEQYPYGELVIE